MDYQPTPRTTVRRLPKRGDYDRATVHAILDAAFVCHVGFVAGDAGPVVIPTLYGRSGDTLYLHGSAASRMLKTLAEGVEASIAVTLVDGLVMARSAFHHSINYRSVVLFGKAAPVTDEEAKNEALRVISDHISPGRWAEVRPPTQRELKATLVLSMPIEEASAKVRTGGPVDDEEDYALPVWAGVLPQRTIAGTQVDDGRLQAGVGLAKSVAEWRR